MKPTFLFPTELEAAGLKDLRPDLDIRICGVGMAQTARTVARMLRDGKPELVLLCGIAGSYERDCRLGEVVAVDVERVAGVPEQMGEEFSSSWHFDRLRNVRSNTVCRCGAEADGAQVENMEGAALFALCNDAGVTCGELRAVSNRVGARRKDWDIPKALDALTAAIDSMF